MTVLDASKVELETARKIFWLLTMDAVFLSSYNEDSGTWDDGSYPAINCNDMFVMGADAEKLSAEDLDVFLEVVRKYPSRGAQAWCAVKRNSKLWKVYSAHKLTPSMIEYNEAIIGVAKILKVDPPLDILIKEIPQETLPKVRWWWQKCFK